MADNDKRIDLYLRLSCDEIDKWASDWKKDSKDAQSLSTFLKDTNPVESGLQEEVLRDMDEGTADAKGKAFERYIAQIFGNILDIEPERLLAGQDTKTIDVDGASKRFQNLVASEFNERMGKADIKIQNQGNEISLTKKLGLNNVYSDILLTLKNYTGRRIELGSTDFRKIFLSIGSFSGRPASQMDAMIQYCQGKGSWRNIYAGLDPKIQQPQLSKIRLFYELTGGGLESVPAQFLIRRNSVDNSIKVYSTKQIIANNKRIYSGSELKITLG